MKMVMRSEESVAVNQHAESFSGSMKGTMEILGDIVSPIDVVWEAEVREGTGECLPAKCVKDS